MADIGSKKSKRSRDLRLLPENEATAVHPFPKLAAVTDLAKFAEGVIALNRKAVSSPASTTPERRTCVVTSLECFQGRPRLNKAASIDGENDPKVTELRPSRKE